MTGRVAGALTAAMVAVAGCGGESGAAATRPTSTTPPAPSPATNGSSRASDRTVAIKGFEYRPARLVVKRGTKVTWFDRDAANHTVTFERGPGDLGNVDPGQRRSARFEHRGTYRYVCQYHPNTHGTIVVR